MNPSRFYLAHPTGKYRGFPGNLRLRVGKRGAVVARQVASPVWSRYSCRWPREDLQTIEMQRNYEEVCRPSGPSMMNCCSHLSGPSTNLGLAPTMQCDKRARTASQIGLLLLFM